jgi:hypothetical protein
MDWKQEAEKQFAIFREVVVERLEPLTEQGYTPIAEEAPMTITFSKALNSSIHVAISYEFAFCAAPPHEFTIWLRRSSPQSDEYAPFSAELPAVLKSYYKVDLFQRGQYRWQYSDRDELIREIDIANQALLKLGVEWLEKPTSKVNWVQRINPQQESQKAEEQNS